MKRIFFVFLFLLSGLWVSAQLSDDQVIDFVRSSHERGMSQDEIAGELVKRGVTQDQLLRLRQRVQQDASAPGTEDLNRFRTPEEPPAPPVVAQAAAGASGQGIFGHDIFTGKSLTFEPSLNIATPDNYVLGPGDEVIIDIWGDSEQTIRQHISPDGTIVVSRLGPIQLNGFTVREADARLKKHFSRIYSSVDGDTPATFIKLSLGQLRSIQVHVMGEVIRPGTYTVSSLATLFHVLYHAGGVNGIGSLRSIVVSRGGVHVADVDVYSYLLDGKTEVDIALKDGDVVLVGPYKNLVVLSGRVKRPMRYEMKDREPLSSLLDFAGGFSGDSYQDAVTVVRRSGRLQEVHNIDKSEYGRFALTDGDIISVGGIIDRFENRLEISGAVFRPGLYALSDSVSTVGELIARAAGLRGDAFTGRTVLTRERPDYSLEVLSVDAGAILSGTSPDIALRNNDIVHVPSIFDLHEEYTVTVSGAVRSPGDYRFAENLTIEDMIVMAGGLLESASTVRVDVARRIKNPSSRSESPVRSEGFSFPVRNGLVVSGDSDFTLQPFDVVTVRTSPGYEVQKRVTVQGEVLFPGGYTLEKHEERLSDLIARSGGALTSAYLRGASLMRTRDRNEEVRMRSTRRLMDMGGPDSLSQSSLNLHREYPVGIELDKAIGQPGSDYDLVLREGDVLQIPAYVGTVSVSGAVLYPNVVSFRKGMSVEDYIRQAGGYAHRARRSAKIVIHMNGTITHSRTLSSAQITPGCEIVIPYRTTRLNRMSFPEILSLGLSATSTAAIVANLINSTK